ncbi:MAG: uracil-DNA glycosylase family protein [Dongiaceae bacterium]
MTYATDLITTQQWLQEMGADEHLALKPTGFYRLNPAPPPKEAPALSKVSVMAKKPSPADHSAAVSLAAAAKTLPELEAAVKNFNGCALKKGAKNTVFCDGVASSPIMFIGEGPGADEDRQGKPFVGVSGQLLDKMLAAINLSRQSNAYITNVVYWRPPGNRAPTPEEIECCRPFFERHIELHKPKVIVLLGGVALKAVFNPKDGIMKMRGTWLEYKTADGAVIPVMPTYHPAFLLRTPTAKRQAWQDLQAIQKKLAELGVAKAA